MAYFLGLKINDDVKPIKVIDKKGNVVPNSILDLVLFTTSFPNDKKLLQYLIDSGSIKEEGKLVYLIDKGQKGNKTYNEVAGCDRTFSSNYRNNFKENAVRSKIHKKILDADFLDHLYAFYLKKMGVYGDSIQYFKDISANPSELKKVIKNLSRLKFSDSVDDYLNRLLDMVNRVISNKGFSSSNEYREYYNVLGEAFDTFSKTDQDIIALCTSFSTKVKKNTISSISNLAQIHRIVSRIQDGDEYYTNSRAIRDDLEMYIDNFIDYTIYSYDKSKKNFRYVHGKRKLQGRNLFDLGVFLSDYDDFELYLAQVMSSNPEKTISTDLIHEEFLDEEDFERLNTTSEEQGIVLRISDAQKYSKLW